MKLLNQIQEQLNTKLQYLCHFGCLLLLIFLVLGCQGQTSDSNNLGAEQANSEDLGRSNTQLTLNDAVLEQSNQTGNLVWKIKAKRTTYSDDRQIGYLEDITANLLQEGKVILKLKGDQGEVREQGNLILLQQNIVAGDARNDMVLQGNRLEWRPLDSVLVITEDLSANRLDTSLSASSANYYTDRESLELTDNVVINNVNPNLVLESDRAVWQVPQQKISTEGQATIVRYAENTVTDRLLSSNVLVDLGRQTANFESSFELRSLQPQLTAAGQTAIWNYQLRSITSDQPMRVVAPEFTVTGNQSTVDLNKELVILSKGIEGKTTEAETIYAQDALWTIANQEVIASGNVIYNKTRPKVALTGDKATINLKTSKAIVVSDSPNAKPVISRIQQVQ